MSGCVVANAAGFVAELEEQPVSRAVRIMINELRMKVRMVPRGLNSGYHIRIATDCCGCGKFAQRRCHRSNAQASGGSGVDAAGPAIAFEVAEPRVALDALPDGLSTGLWVAAKR